MRLFSEYLFASLFFVCAGYLMLIGEVGSALILAILGIYLPTKILINDLSNSIWSWPINNLMKVIWSVVGGLSIFCAINLVTLNFSGFLGGLFGIGMLNLFHENVRAKR